MNILTLTGLVVTFLIEEELRPLIISTFHLLNLFTEVMKTTNQCYRSLKGTGGLPGLDIDLKVR